MKYKRLVDKWEEDSKMYLFLNVKDRLMPTLYGGIVGDMLGVPVEFMKRGTYEVTDVQGYGTYNQPPGTWSDDTSLTLCLIENMMEEGTMSGLMKKISAYQDHAYLTPHNKMFDIGRTTAESIDRFKSGIPPENCGGNSVYDNGNGAIMRISPIAFTLINNFNFIEKTEIIKRYTKITHAHPRSIVGSIIYIELLLRLYHNNSLSQGIVDIKELFQESFDENHIYLEELKHYQRIFAEDFFNTPREKIASDGYIVHSLEAAIWSLGTSSSFKEAVLKAVNLGEDTDTVASITGSLAGMHYKIDEIPIDWLNKIVKKQEIDDLIDRFLKYCTDQFMMEKYGSTLD